MSYGYASILSRIEDAISKFIRKLSPFARKLLYAYTTSISIESSRAENIIVRALLRMVSMVYVFFSFAEHRVVRISSRFAKALQSVQSSLEDAASYASLYMNILFVVAILAAVVIVWIL